MNTIIEDGRVLNALRVIAKNIVALADLKLPKFPNLQTIGLFTTSYHGEHEAEVIVHGVQESELRNLISFANSYEYHDWSMFGKGLGWSVPLNRLMPYIVLCNGTKYKSEICNRVITFN